MNEIPTTRDGLRRGLSAIMAKHNVRLVRPPFWAETHEYLNTPSMEQGDLWLYANRTGVRSLITVIRTVLVPIEFRPAVTIARALEAQRLLEEAYEGDTHGMRSFLQQPLPPQKHLDDIVNTLINASLTADQQRESGYQMTSVGLYDTLHAIALLDGLLSKLGVPPNAHA